MLLLVILNPPELEYFCIQKNDVTGTNIILAVFGEPSIDYKVKNEGEYCHSGYADYRAESQIMLLTNDVQRYVGYLNCHAHIFGTGVLTHLEGLRSLLCALITGQRRIFVR